MNNILVIPDVHTGLGEDTSRLAALGRFITKRRPHTIVQIGDFADMASLSSFDSALSKAGVVGDYAKEVQAVKDSLAILFRPLKKLQKKQRKNKKKIYKPRTILTLGNHDQGRYNRVIEKDPIILGSSISWEDLDYSLYFKEIIDYKKAIEVEGILFTHHLTTMMGRALGGAINPARALLNNAKQSVVVGHSHLYDYSVASKLDGTKMHGLSAGCFIGDQKFDYATGAQHLWTDGVSMLNNAKDGNYDLEFISTTRILQGVN